MPFFKEFSVAWVTGIVLLLSGCSDSTPKTYPVNGKIVLPGGDGAALAGHHVDAVKKDEPNTRASGIIAADGSFSLETLYGGTILKGVREGKYELRILQGESDDGKRLKKPPIANKFFRFETAGLLIDVPTSGDVTLTLPAK